jgi:hypothetical protein
LITRKPLVAQAGSLCHQISSFPGGHLP